MRFIRASSRRILAPALSSLESLKGFCDHASRPYEQTRLQSGPTPYLIHQGLITQASNTRWPIRRPLNMALRIASCPALVIQSTLPIATSSPLTGFSSHPLIIKTDCTPCCTNAAGLAEEAPGGVAAARDHHHRHHHHVAYPDDIRGRCNTATTNNPGSSPCPNHCPAWEASAHEAHGQEASLA